MERRADYVVNDEEVGIEFERLLKIYVSRMSTDEVIKNMASIKRQAREQAIGRKLLLERALRSGLRVSDAEIEEAISSSKRAIADEAAFAAQLAEKGLSPETLRQAVRSALLIEKLVISITGKAVSATEKEAASYFAENRNEFAETASFEQVKEIIILALTNERKNRLLVDYIFELKREAGLAQAEPG